MAILLIIPFVLIAVMCVALVTSLLMLLWEVLADDTHHRRH